VDPQLYSGGGRLHAEVQASWAMIADLSARLAETSMSFRSPDRPTGSLQPLCETYGETAAALLEPIESCLRLRPIRRSLEALQECDRQNGTGASTAHLRLDSRFQHLVVHSVLDLCEPWRIWLSRGPEEDWKAWEKRRAIASKRASDLVADYARQPRELVKPGKIASAKAAIREKQIESWWRLERSVSTILGMEVTLRDLGLYWLRGAQDMIESLRLERSSVISASEKRLIWMKEVAASGIESALPPLELATPDERIRSWTRHYEKHAGELLPEQVEVVRSYGYESWRKAHPRKAFLSTFETHGRAPVLRIVGDYWEQSATLLRESERSKEILDYWRTSATGDPESNPLFVQARENTLPMLAEQIEKLAGPDDLESRFANSFWVWEEEISTALEVERSGWLPLLRGSRGRRLFLKAVNSGREKSRYALQRASRWGADRFDRALEAIGAKLPERPTATPVVRRTTLRDILHLPASKGELPGLYTVLFKLVPVEDRRFLIGRERELAGLEQAVKDWGNGRFAACLFVGARGSGKTSLLNCACAVAFAGRELIRTEFTERILTPEALDDFFRKMLGLQPEADLVEGFAAKRRIVIIEEAERVFLRQVGGFDAADHFVRRIQNTASTTLWVITMNQKAFRVLDAAMQFGRVFSHRISAMSVSREDLENAILERHRLSGLRLDFAPPPTGDPRINRLRAWFGLQDSPQALFFDSLYQQSGGVFRSAFELWLSSIERAEGRILKIRQPLEPAFAQFRSELTQEDHFTLLSIQEHGSLKVEEVASTLCENTEASRLRLDRLKTLGLIEKDPEHPGLRIRPEAQRFTDELLRRVNLF
jgi:hypothetical protein